MDPILVNYLRSGEAWVLVGSGPSTEMGYPSWRGLAEEAIRLMKIEGGPQLIPRAVSSLSKGDYPGVFDIAKASLGTPRLLEGLRSVLKPARHGRIYDLLAKWPVPVYLTTNFDDELQGCLAHIGESYISYINSPDHLSLLEPGLSGGIYKLHGDLRSEQGLVLGATDYLAVSKNVSWLPWRTKLTAIFQLNTVVVVGHSLNDPNIRHVLHAAQQGASVHRPVCWLAPDIPPDQAREYLEKYRIRVVSYDNRDGSHQNLSRLIEHLSQFTYPRMSIGIRHEIARVTESSRGPSAAAPGFFVFSRLSTHETFYLTRVSAMCAAIQSVVPQLAQLGTFSLSQALHAAGWPTDADVGPVFARDIVSEAIQQELLAEVGDGLRLGPKAEQLASTATQRYLHSRQRFKQSLVLRIRRTYPDFTDLDATNLADDIESSLVGFFREAGLALATTLLSRVQRLPSSPIPSSIIRFISEAASQYNDLLHRQAFCTIAVDIFAQPEDPDKDYLGRVSQGFFAFHALGLFGEAAEQRLSLAKDTVWIIDSSAQIPALALAAPTHALFRETFLRLNSMGVRLFSSEKLFQEAVDHFWFAHEVVRENGPTSPLVIAAALGHPPFRKANQFLEGFIRWRAAGNLPRWEDYLSKTFGTSNPNVDLMRSALRRTGIEVVPIHSWPGFAPPDLLECQGLRDEIVKKWQDRLPLEASDDPELMAEFYDKADPEAEALLVVTKERDGSYHILAQPGQPSPAWFVSQTSMLNVVHSGMRVTWQPEAFLRFTTTLSPITDPLAASRAFDILLMALTQAGASLVDDRILVSAFGGIIDDASISVESISAEYQESLAWKYGEPAAAVLARLPLASRPMGAIQLANEIAIVQSDKAKYAEARAVAAQQRAETAEREAARLRYVEQEIEAKRRRRAEKARKRKPSRRGKKKRARKK